MIIGGSILSVIVALLAVMFYARKAGKDAVENKSKGETLDDVYLAKKARESVDRGTAAARRVRKKYERK